MRGLSLLVMSTLVVAGCLGASDETIDPEAPVVVDSPMEPVLDPYYDVVPEAESTLERNTRFLTSGFTGGDMRFHTWAEVLEKLSGWNETYPDLVDLEIIGTTTNGIDIPMLIVTNESVPGDDKVVPFLDAAHHGNEFSSSELMMFTMDFLLTNHATNQTVQALLRDIEIWFVPIVNPDGFEAGTRHNANGVNLNRNYDVDWGNPLGTSNSLIGTVGDTAGRPTSGIALVAENCGPYAMSEPETQAIAAVMERVGERAAFYLTGHAPTHAVISVPAAADPPFDVPQEHAHVMDEELDWIRTNTEYEAGRAQWGDFSAGLPYAASGSSMDYFYKILQKPGFTIEVEYFPTSITAEDYPFRLLEQYEGLRFWMEVSLPIVMHMLVNAENLAQWEAPTEPVLLYPGYDAGPIPDSPSDWERYLH